ncbi:MAG: ORF6N domain-containing protein [Phycisphaerae bacterium]|nr:ORF6N domain-containing protein [Phycisphaerae bacterium]
MAGSPDEKIAGMILLLRGERVMLDRDLAELYGVATKALNRAVKRNLDRFPADFMFQLTWEEAMSLISQFSISSSSEAVGQDSRSQNVTLKGAAEPSRRRFGTLKRGANPKYRPYAFTEHGAIMAANVLNSPRAVQASVFVVRTFVRLRRMLLQNAELAAKLAELERKFDKHDGQIVALIQAMRQLMAPPPEPPRKRIGYQSEIDS